MQKPGSEFPLPVIWALVFVVAMGMLTMCLTLSRY